MEPRPVEALAAPRLRLDHVDGMRAAAALVVYWNHAYAQTWNAFAGSYPTGFFAPNRYSLVFGHLSVTVFIVVSGFCLALPIVANRGQIRGGLREFLRRRARRILPPYYAAVLVCLLLIWTVIGKPTGSLWDVPIQLTSTSILIHLLLLQDLFATSHINYVFWSIAVEWQIYFLVPLLAWAWRRRGAAFVVLGALAVGYALRIGFDGTRIERAHPHYIGMFTLGMFAAHVVSSTDARLQALRERVPWALLSALAFGAVLVATLLLGVGGAVERFHLLDLPVGLMTLAVLVASSSRKPSLLTRAFSFRPLVFVGVFSYSLYLIHAPLLQVLWQYVLVPLGVSQNLMFVALMSGGLAVILGVSYLFHLAFEAPFLRAARAATAARQAALPVP